MLTPVLIGTVVLGGLGSFLYGELHWEVLAVFMLAAWVVLAGVRDFFDKVRHKGVIAGAGVDVFETEPPIAERHPLFSAPNLIATPHVAFATAESMQKRAVIVMNNLETYLDGVPQNVVK
ncbi:hypothetical protein SDC9_197727 [bioreactor metagenome]|uniref:D-isomer specific 2-hydroxyacid dehydrogenase NAD-binding domain-containing protein n=1 Tax=bioreactor metagenome TaxID=1076179 RepID=A0A645IFK3_9ZZZZ